MKAAAARVSAWFFTTFAILVGIGLVTPVVLGMALSGRAAESRRVEVLGVLVFNTRIDGTGGFEAGYGPGLFVMAALGALLIGFITGVWTWRSAEGKLLSATPR